MRSVRLSLLGATGCLFTTGVAQMAPNFILPHQWGSIRYQISKARSTGILPPVQRNRIGAPVENVRSTLSDRTVAPDKEDARRGSPLPGWLDRLILQRVHFTGHRRLGYHAHQVDGDFDAFSSLNYYGMGGSRFTDTGNLFVSGSKVLGFLSFDLAFADNRYSDPEAQRLTLNYDRGPVHLSLGDIRGTLTNTNPYTPLNRSVKGAAAEYRAGRLQFKAVRSESKGSARTVSFQGQNSAGPYYLQSGRVIADTVEVLLDGERMSLLDDYVVNSDIGSITFVRRSIPPTSTITVTYESYGFTTNPGTLQGAGLAYDLGRFGRFGFTAAEQRSGFSAGGNTIVQRYFGYGSAAAQYWLDYEPIPGSVIVRVDGILQVEGPADGPGGDYFFDPGSPLVFVFKRAIATTQQIDVVYRPKIVRTVDGDRNVWGLDYRLPLGREGVNGYLQYAQATGELKGPTPSQGTARGIEGMVKHRNLTLTGSVQDVPPGYVTVESRGFRRNERSANLNVAWDMGRFTYTGMVSNSSVASRSFSDGAPEDAVSRLTQAGATASYSDPSGLRWSLRHTRNTNRLDSETRIDSTSLTAARRFGRIAADLSFDRQSGFGPIQDGLELKEGTVSLNTVRLGAKYDVDDDLAFDARASLSQVSALGKSGTGHDASIAARYRPSDRLSASATWAQSDSGELATLGGFANGTGYGYGGNGFSGGALGSGAFGAGGTKAKLATLSAEYRASRRLTLNGHGLLNESEGSLSSNARTLSYGLGADLDVGNLTLLSVSLDATRTSFLSDVARTSETTSMSAFLSGAPRGPWSYRIGVNSFLTGGSSDFQQDSWGFDTYLGYRLAPRQRLSFVARNGRSTGQYGQFERAAYLTYEYQIFRNVALGIGYKWRDVQNLSNGLASGAYRSSGIDIDLTFDFGS